MCVLSQQTCLSVCKLKFFFSSVAFLLTFGSPSILSFFCLWNACYPHTQSPRPLLQVACFLHNFYHLYFCFALRYFLHLIFQATNSDPNSNLSFLQFKKWLEFLSSKIMCFISENLWDFESWISMSVYIILLLCPRPLANFHEPAPWKLCLIVWRHSLIHLEDMYEELLTCYSGRCLARKESA